MNALTPGYPNTGSTPKTPGRKPDRFPRMPLILGLGLIGFAFTAIVFGMKTGVGTMINIYDKPVAMRDIIIDGTHDSEITIIDARSGEVIKVLPTSEGGFIRGSLRALSRIRHVSETPTTLPYRLIQWENGSVSLSDTATGERLYLNAFGPDNVAAYSELLASRGKKP
ncbi:photosynthetic complex assembly protein PuhC [Hoeflea olei]|uniref:Phosphonoacetaldehyde hydrolase n=1 Tax=Hoeflea olei TaxID=1480615 RepID=A0A1C1YY88_9HYPH|nr:photosynthetic complex assembly protein PuhC [Hoeflea olei]OCW58481.1 phosphonoacetaldehyde hydrolase [Hoeflea olei]